ncbi:S49 family peptidase [soil metagenome]
MTEINPNNQIPPTPAELMWERKTIENLLQMGIKEQRRSRRWRIFFRLILLILIAGFIYLLFSSDKAPLAEKAKAHTALIDISGAIMPGADAGADEIVKGLREAFKDKKAVGLILRINSPGGTPVQASYVYDEIKRLKTGRPDMKVYTVCVDICASAAYYIASSSDYIYANPSSLIGSIGVVLNSFGFVESMNKLGIERRMITSGNEKGFLDPFSPLKQEDVKYAKDMLETVHKQFIDNVKAGRGARLKETPEMFSGLIWTGSQALPLGLIDGFGSAGFVAREVIKNESIVDYTAKPGYLIQVFRNVGTTFSQQMGSYLGLGQASLR